MSHLPVLYLSNLTLYLTNKTYILLYIELLPLTMPFSSVALKLLSPYLPSVSWPRPPRSFPLSLSSVPSYVMSRSSSVEPRT